MNVIFLKGEVPSNFWKILIKPLYKKEEEIEWIDISLNSIGSKLLWWYFLDFSTFPKHWQKRLSHISISIAELVSTPLWNEILAIPALEIDNLFKRKIQVH